MVRRIFSARCRPMLRRVSYTEAPSITESGRARYTYSNRHGESCGFAAHYRLWKPPASSKKIASPAPTSRTGSNPKAVSATLSEATRYSALSPDVFLP